MKSASPIVHRALRRTILAAFLLLAPGLAQAFSSVEARVQLSNAGLQEGDLLQVQISFGLDLIQDTKVANSRSEKLTAADLESGTYSIEFGSSQLLGSKRLQLPSDITGMTFRVFGAQAIVKREGVVVARSPFLIEDATELMREGDGTIELSLYADSRSALKASFPMSVEARQASFGTDPVVVINAIDGLYSWGLLRDSDGWSDASNYVQDNIELLLNTEPTKRQRVLGFMEDQLTALSNIQGDTFEVAEFFFNTFNSTLSVDPDKLLSDSDTTLTRSIIENLRQNYPLYFPHSMGVFANSLQALRESGRYEDCIMLAGDVLTTVPADQLETLQRSGLPVVLSTDSFRANLFRALYEAQECYIMRSLSIRPRESGSHYGYPSYSDLLIGASDGLPAEGKNLLSAYMAIGDLVPWDCNAMKIQMRMDRELALVHNFYADVSALFRPDFPMGEACPA